jgi:hypothetical protein
MFSLLSLICTCYCATQIVSIIMDRIERKRKADPFYGMHL